MSATLTLKSLINRRADERGILRTTVSALAAETMLSASTVKRSLTELVVVGLIDVRTKEGRSGGLMIRTLRTPETRSQTSPETSSKLGHETSSKLGQNPGHAMPLTAGGDPKGSSPPAVREPVHENRSSVDATPASPPATRAGEAPWFVCCVWYDDNGQMWSHGRDGYPPYIPCASEAEAERLAKKHRETLHKDRSEDGIGRFPRVDICRAVGEFTTVSDDKGRTTVASRPGKVLHHSLGELPETKGGNEDE